MTVARYTFQRGETISLALDAITGSTGDVSSITARIRKLLPGKTDLASTTPVSESFDITTRAATAELPAGWLLTLSPAKSVKLQAGNYLTDAEITLAGGTYITDPVMLIIKEPATV